MGTKKEFDFNTNLYAYHNGANIKLAGTLISIWVRIMGFSRDVDLWIQSPSEVLARTI